MSIPCGSRSHSRSRSPQAMATSSTAEVPAVVPADTPQEETHTDATDPPPEDVAEPWDDISWIRFPDGTWLQFPDLPTHHSAPEMDQLWINWFSTYQDQAGVANTMDNIRRGHTNSSLFEHALHRSMSSWHYDQLQPRLINFWRSLNEPAPRSLLSWNHPELQQGKIHSMSEAGHLISQPIFFVINYFNLTEAWHRTGDDALSAQTPEIARWHTSMNMWDPLVFQATQHYEHNVEKFTYIHKMTPRSVLHPWNNQYWPHLCHALSQHIGISWDIDFPPTDIKLEVNMGRDEPFTPTPDCSISWVLHRCFPLWLGLTPLLVYVTASLNSRESRPLGEHLWARAGQVPGDDANLHGYDFTRYELPR